jgi:hypothetical protein
MLTPKIQPKRCSWVSLLLLVVSSGFGAVLAAPAALAQEVLPSSLPDFQQRALLIMDANVISDPVRTTNPCKQPSQLNVWSFGALMKKIAGTSDDAVARDFIKNWLKQLRTDQQINGQPVGARDIDKVWLPWKNANFDIKLVPFQLLAIVNRIDLFRSPLLTGENTGEIRFVFGAVDISDQNTCTPLNFTVNLEYGVRKSSCADFLAWAASWAALGQPNSPGPSDQQYRVNLQALTDTVTRRNISLAKPNGSAIDHVRTNEGIVDSSDWQMREFRLNPTSGQLVQDTVTLTPRDDLNGTAKLNAFLGTIAQGIAAQDYWIPRSFPGSPADPLLGAVTKAGTAWPAQPSGFAMNTCSGCHSGQSNSGQPLFTHIDPTNGMISQFLVDQLTLRENELNTLAANGCSASVTQVPGQKSLVH